MRTRATCNTSATSSVFSLGKAGLRLHGEFHLHQRWVSPNPTGSQKMPDKWDEALIAKGIP